MIIIRTTARIIFFQVEIIEESAARIVKIVRQVEIVKIPERAFINKVVLGPRILHHLLNQVQDQVVQVQKEVDDLLHLKIIEIEIEDELVDYKYLHHSEVMDKDGEPLLREEV